MNKLFFLFFAFCVSGCTFHNTEKHYFHPDTLDFRNGYAYYANRGLFERLDLQRLEGISNNEIEIRYYSRYPSLRRTTIPYLVLKGDKAKCSATLFVYNVEDGKYSKNEFNIEYSFLKKTYDRIVTLPQQYEITDSVYEFCEESLITHDFEVNSNTCYKFISYGCLKYCADKYSECRLMDSILSDINTYYPSITNDFPAELNPR